jgi:hypothetical protein
MEDLGIHFECRFFIYTLYEQVNPKTETSQGWVEEINYDIEIKQGCPLSLTLYGIYIDGQ